MALLRQGVLFCFRDQFVPAPTPFFSNCCDCGIFHCFILNLESVAVEFPPPPNFIKGFVFSYADFYNLT